MSKIKFRTIFPLLFLLCSLVISNGLCMTVRPQVAKFEIIKFENLNEITTTKNVTLTISCVEGSGSGSINLMTDPSDIPLSFTPTLETPSMEVGDAYTLTIRVQNLGTPTNRDFLLNAIVKNSIDLFCDNATSRGTLLKKKGESTFITVVTKYNEKTIDNLPIRIEYFDYSQTGFTGSNNNGSVRFDFETSADIRALVIFVGNDVYLADAKTLMVYGGHEETVIFELNKINDSTEETMDKWESNTLIFLLIIAVISVGIILIIVSVYLWEIAHSFLNRKKGII